MAMRSWPVVVIVLGLAACSDEPTRVSAGDQPLGDQRYTASGTVLESQEHGPQLCLGGVDDSYPPQCGGPDVVGWDWTEVDDEESAGGTTWGSYSVVGTWDGTRLTQTEPPGRPPEPPADAPGVDLSTPCEPPSGGWAVVDPATATQAGLDAATAYASAQPEYAGSWLDQSINPAYDEEPIDEYALNDPALLVLNLRFTGDLDRHQAAVREVWGGSLCVTGAERTEAELSAIQNEVQQELGALSSFTDVAGVVRVQVVLAEPGLQEELDERYGEGVVEVTSALRPVDG